jgi:WD40 repeat protein
LVAVVGASGSGKSSVLRAGLIGAVRAGEVAGVERAHLMTPGAAPRRVLEDGRSELVVVDQFEELFTLCDDAGRRHAFIAALLEVGGPVAIGMRADLYGRLGDHPELARAVAANQVLLAAMSDAELERAVTEPAELAGLRLEPGLGELALRDVAGEPGALPLLSHALRATWERRNGRTLTVEGYREAGGVASAVAQTADRLVASLPDTQRLLTRSVFLRLTELGDGAAESRRRATIEELVPEGVSPHVVQALLERLAEARLVTLGDGTAEVAHEVLIRAWPTLRRWLDEDREGIRLHRQLGSAARLWDAGGRDASDLYRGTRLGAAADWAELHREELNATERSFIDASLREASRERRAQLRANRRLRGLLAGAVVLLVVAALAGVVALIQRSHAQAQALTSDAERLGAQAQTEPNLDRALLLAVAAVKLQNRVETRADLLAVLQRSPALIRFARPSRSEITALSVSPNGRLLAIADVAGVVRFIDLATWQPRGAPVRLTDVVAPGAMRFSPDGRTLTVITESAAQSELRTIAVASHIARRIQAWPGPVPAPPHFSSDLAYSPDGRNIAVSLGTGASSIPVVSAERVLMLDAATGRTRWQHRYAVQPGQKALHVSFTPNGALVTSAPQGETVLWDARSGRILRRFALGGVPAVSADGRQVALAVNSRHIWIPKSSVAVLDLRTGRERTLLGDLPGEWIETIAFAPGGSRVVAGAMNGVYVWDVATGAIAETYTGQPGRRALMTLDPRGTTVISSAQDGSIAAFDLSGARRLGRHFRWNVSGQSCPNAPCQVVNRQSQLMATDQGDGTVALVDLRTLRPTRTLPARDGATATAIAFLSDGRTLVTGGTNGRVTFWDVGSGRVTRTLRFADPVWWVASSHDGRLLAVQTQANNSPNSRVAVLQIGTGKVLQNHLVRYGLGGVQFSRDGRELVALGCCGPGSTLVAWDTRTGAQLFSRTGGLQGNAMDLAMDLTPDSRVLGVSTADGKLLLLHARTGKQIGAPIQVAAGHIADVSFSPDGTTFAAGSNDGTASLWDLRARKRLGTPFPPVPGVVPGVLIEPNGRVLINYLADAFEWPTDVRAWERFACRVAGRDLAPQEWHDLLPGRAYEPACPNTT